MDFPSSNARSFFEILMPGVFLLINLIFFLFLPLFNKTYGGAKPENITALCSGSSIIAFLLCFGFLLGVVLRMMKTSLADSWSAWFIKHFSPQEAGKGYISESFFYQKWMLETYEIFLPGPSYAICNKIWNQAFTASKAAGAGSGTSPAAQNQENNMPPVVNLCVHILKLILYFCNAVLRLIIPIPPIKKPAPKDDPAVRMTAFYNLCKGIAIKHDENSAKEILAAEALTRFIAGSLYALIFCFGLTLCHGLLVLCLSPWRQSCFAFAAAMSYLLLITLILYNFRTMRLREVNTVFAAALANHVEFKKIFP